MAKSRQLRRLAVWIGVLLVVCGLALLVVIQNFRNFRVPFLSKQDVSSLITIAKGTAAQVVVVKRPSEQGYVPHASMNTHEIDATRFQADAKLFDAWTLQLQIAQEAVKVTRAGAWTRSSAELRHVQSQVDPWGHHVCLTRRGNVLAVISAGPRAPADPVCRDISISEAELRELPPARLLETPAGNLLLVIDGNRLHSRQPTS